jgi:hypothetical protein
MHLHYRSAVLGSLEAFDFVLYMLGGTPEIHSAHFQRFTELPGRFIHAPVLNRRYRWQLEQNF